MKTIFATALLTFVASALLLKRDETEGSIAKYEQEECDGEPCGEGLA